MMIRRRRRRRRRSIPQVAYGSAGFIRRFKNLGVPGSKPARE
jgi:hypothetical protein